MSECLTPKNEAARKARRNRLLKIWIAALVAVGLCGWVVYRWFNPPSEHYHDFTINSAIAWLEKADAQKFEVCKKNIVDADGWFDWFVKDRTSLGKITKRELYQQTEIPGASAGMKRSELKFDSRFALFKDPRSQVTERVIVESNGKDKFNVLMADYWLRRAFAQPTKRIATESEKAAIMAVSAEALKQIDAGNIDFFKQAYREQVKSPDYFGWRKYIFADVKKPKSVIELCELFSKNRTTPRQFAGVDKIWIPQGRTGFEEVNTNYKFSVQKDTQTKDYILVIILSRDLYQGKSAPWKFEYIFSRELKKEKK